MRDELELIEKTERYLAGTLTPDEAEAFERQIDNDASLKAAVAAQHDIMQGLSRASIRQQVQRAGRKYGRIKQLQRWAIAGTAGLLIIAGAYFLLRTRHSTIDSIATTAQEYNGTILPALNEQGTGQWATADSVIPAQVFEIDAAKDTVIETAGGIVMAIPASAFLKARGAAVSGKVRLCIKEALDALTIMSAGLSTMARDSLLETDGMFFVDVRQGSDILRINPANGIYAEVPGDATKPGLQLFSGRRMPGGTIDWIKPVPLLRNLVPADILMLDFYPPDYLHLLHYNGYETSNKRFADSVYYSLAALFDNNNEADVNSDATAVPREDFNYGQLSDTARAIARDSSRSPSSVCGINPAKIKAIWSSRYGHTLLSTREFEQRIKLIHQSRNPGLLDLYVANLDKNLFEIDEVAAARSDGKIKKGFLQFASLRQGKVANGSKQAEKLRDYYAQRTALFTEAIAAAVHKARAEQAALDNEAGQKMAEHAADNTARTQQTFTEELEINLNSAYAQLGLSRLPNSLPPASGNRVVITNTGWSNVDRYVVESTTNRATLNYTDPQSGKKAVIEYKPITVTVEDAKSYDRLLVYLLPYRLSSFIGLNEVGGTFMQKLNDLMSYDLVCIGFKGAQRYYLHAAKVEPKRYDAVRLKAIDSPELQRALSKWQIGGQASAVSKEIAYALWDLQNIEAQKRRLKWGALIADLKEHLFPCRMEWDARLFQLQ